MSPHPAHQRAEELRESDQHLLALQSLDETLVGYQKEQNYFGFVQALQSRVLTYKHLFWLTQDQAFLTLASSDAQSSLEIAVRHQITEILGSCYFRLGEMSLLAGDYLSAVENFQRSLDSFSGHPAEKGDYLYHLGEAVFLQGDKDRGKSLMLQGLQIIRDNTSGLDPFLSHVWESGCLLTLAHLTYQEDLPRAQAYLSAAKQIIDSDPKLIIRKRQLADIVNELNSIKD